MFLFLLVSSKDKGANYLYFPTAGPQSTNVVLRGSYLDFLSVLHWWGISVPCKGRHWAPGKDPVPAPPQPLDMWGSAADPCEVFKLHRWIKTRCLCSAPDEHSPVQKVSHVITGIALSGREEDGE